MERIGIAASKMSKGNQALYNLWVILISFLFALFIFILAGGTIILALILLSYIGEEVMLADVKRNWSSIMAVCMVCLSAIVTVFYLMALAKNLKLTKSPRS